MKKLLPALFVLCSFLLFGQDSQLITYEQPIPCLNKKFTIIAHFVQDITGATNIQEQAVLDNVAAMNEYWDEICVSFEVCEFRTIPNHNYDLLDGDIEWPQMNIDYHQANRINIFYVDNIEGLAVQAAGFATLGGIANLGGGGVVLKKDSDIGVMLHEMGHYFGLEHTFEGNGTELANGDNCETEGDGICDTPADPFVPNEEISDYVSDCTFISNKVDANGEFYRPDIGNIMSYYPCTCGFTTGQYLRMAENCVAVGGSMW